MITGAPREREYAQAISDSANRDRCVNIAGYLEFSELPLLYTVSHLMLTNDSGPAHFSSVTELKTYVIFGPETPALYGSMGNSTPIYAGLACSPCVSAYNHRRTPCNNPVCVKSITPEYVFSIVKSSLVKQVIYQ